MTAPAPESLRGGGTVTETMRDPEFFDDSDFSAEEEEPQVRRRDLWQRLSQLMIVFIFLLVLAGILRIFWPEIERHRELSAEVDRLEKIRDKRLERVAELQRQNEWMLTDREYLESVARDRLDLANEDEIVVRIDRNSAARALEIERQRENQLKMERELAARAAALEDGEAGLHLEQDAVARPSGEATSVDGLPQKRVLRALPVEIEAQP